MHDRISANFYIKQPVRGAFIATSNKGELVGMQEKAQEIIARFGQVGERLGVSLGCQRFAWPKFREKDPTSPIVDAASNGDSPDHEKYDADVSVCVLPEIFDADHIVGHLVARGRSNLFTCVVTVADLPRFDNEQTAAFFSLLQVLPTKASRIPGSEILEPYAHDERNKVWDKTKGPVKKGLMSIRQMNEVTEAFVANLLISVHVQKYGLN